MNRADYRHSWTYSFMKLPQQMRVQPSPRRHWGETVSLFKYLSWILCSEKIKQFSIGNAKKKNTTNGFGRCKNNNKKTHTQTKTSSSVGITGYLPASSSVLESSSLGSTWTCTKASVAIHHWYLFWFWVFVRIWLSYRCLDLHCHHWPA